MKLLKAFLAVMLLTMATAYGGSVITPKDNRGETAPVDYAGATPYVYGADASTGPVLIGTARRGVVYGVIASSVAVGTYLVFRDSNTANATSSTHTIVYASTDSSNGSGNIYSGASNTRLYKFPVPIRFLNGIVVGASQAPSAGGTSSWTVLYRTDNVD